MMLRNVATGPQRLSSTLILAIDRQYRRCPSYYCAPSARAFSSRTRKRGLSGSSAAASSFSESEDIIDSPSSSRIVDVTTLAEEMRQSVRNYTRNCKEPVRLAGILAVDAMSEQVQVAEVYASHIAETLAEDGIIYEHVECPGTEPQDIALAIEEMNHRSDVHGILVYYPIFRRKTDRRVRHQHQHHHDQHHHHHRQHRGPYLHASHGVYYKCYDDYLRDLVRTEKDVEGLNNCYKSRWQFRARGKRLHNNYLGNNPHHHQETAGISNQVQTAEAYVPCTALAVKTILEAYHAFPNYDAIKIHEHFANNTTAPTAATLCPEQLVALATRLPWLNTTVTVINRSEILGRPLAVMLALKGAKVYSVDEHSILLFQNNGKMRRCTEPHMTLEWCLEQSTVVVTGVPDPNFQLPLDPLIASAENNGNVTVVNVSEFYNVNEQQLLERSGITFIPQVGKVTVAALEHNLIRLHQHLGEA